MGGYRYLDIPMHREGDILGEQEMLQRVCDLEGAGLFISTWHTSTLSTPLLLMVHDMLPEILLGEQRLLQPRWQEKEVAVAKAAAYVTVSENTARDLVRWHPETIRKPIHVMHNGVEDSFRGAPQETVAAFRKRHRITSPYYLYVGPRNWYKNFEILLEAFQMVPDAASFAIVSPHGAELEPEFAQSTAASAVIITGRLTEEELVAAYSGAVALVYPSQYEGFGLPVLEAMACGCPVIASTTPVLREVCGDAALFFRPDDALALALAMLKVRSHDLRRKLIRRGRERAAIFTWQRSASQLIRAAGSLSANPPVMEEL